MVGVRVVVMVVLGLALGLQLGFNSSAPAQSAISNHLMLIKLFSKMFLFILLEY